MVHPVILNLPSEILMLRVQIPYKASGKSKWDLKVKGENMPLTFFAYLNLI
jgi:hypothetical protein